MVSGWGLRKNNFTFSHPCGSIKDRMAKYILDRSEELGLLKPDAHILWSYFFLTHKEGFSIVLHPEASSYHPKLCAGLISVVVYPT